MSTIEPNKVNVEYRDNIGGTKPILDRKYTITHSDETGDLYVTIGKSFAQDKIEPLRDEVLMNFYQQGNRLYLLGSVLVDSDNPNFDAKKRTEIFTREMPKALQALRYADKTLFEEIPMLDEIPVYIFFESANPEYSKVQDFGIMKDYII